jgi:formamidopyrimidine-DNA glycosylase
MPELPEVETIRRGLKKYLIGHRIKKIIVNLPRIFSGEIKKIIDAKIVGVRRFGKALVIDLDNGYSIAVHVKMTGQLIYRSNKKSNSYKLDKVEDLPGPYTHIIIKLDRNTTLFYNDMRQFGWMVLVQTIKLTSIPFFKNLGREPLKDLTFENFSEILRNSTTHIKTVLMDQKKISGIGNIYANDALFVASIHPLRKASTLSSVEQKKLFKAIEEVLIKGIEAGGASKWSYVNVLGIKGKYQDYFQVYGQEGKSCRRCDGVIKRISIGQRGTFFCEVCQK